MTLDRLAEVLRQAEIDRMADVEIMAAMTEDELEYLAHVDQLEDPVTDGIEDNCV